MLETEGERDPVSLADICSMARTIDMSIPTMILLSRPLLPLEGLPW